MAGRHARGRRYVLAEPAGNAITSGPAGPAAGGVGELACRALKDAGWPSEPGEQTADAVDGVHGEFLMNGIATSRRWRLVRWWLRRR
jgi:hypothetical protein